MFQQTQQFSLITIGLTVTLVYFMWMDVALYINLQKMPVLPGPNNTSSNKQNDVANSFSPVYPVHVKQLMLGPISHYVYNSFGHWIVTYSNVASYLTADAVSAIGLSFAIICAKLITSDSLRVRQLGVIFWQLRDLMDDLDGWVARKRNVELGFSIQTSSFGYYKDGLFDAAGTICLLFGLCIHLHKSSQFFNAANSNGPAYHRLELPVVDKTSGNKKVEKMNSSFSDTLRSLHRRSSPCVTTVCLFMLQVVLSSVCWNLALIGYHRLLETYQVAQTPAQLLEQNAALKSSTFWMVAYLWRWINPLMLIQYIMVAILYNRALEYMYCIQRMGFVPIIMVTVLTKVYYWILHANLVSAGEL